MQNRVDPFSALHAVRARGLFTGNRGRLHDPQTHRIMHRLWASESWVICALHAPTSPAAPAAPPGTWTPLFFLDEAVGLAAGHRPCHGCRKAEAAAFRQAVGIPRVKDLNAAINAEMKQYLRARAPVRRQGCLPVDLPDGAFFAQGEQAFLKWRGAAFPFHFTGYGPPHALPDHALRLTPVLTCQALANGYTPVLHPSLNHQQQTGD